MFSWIVSSFSSLFHFSSRVFTPRSVVAASSSISFFALAWSSFSNVIASTAHSFYSYRSVHPSRQVHGSCRSGGRETPLLIALLANSHLFSRVRAQDVAYAQSPHRL